jgi:hypothetical protein
VILGLQFSGPIKYYYLLLLVLIAVIVINLRLEDSRIGRAWQAIREDEVAAQAMGINTTRIKLLAFAMGASFGGVAGGMFAAMQGFISPESFVMVESVMVLAMVVLGGMGNIWGVIVGALLLSFVPELLRHTVDPLQRSLFGHLIVEPEVIRMLLFGLALMLMMLFRPAGLWPSRVRRRELRRPQRRQRQLRRVRHHLRERAGVRRGRVRGLVPRGPGGVRGRVHQHAVRPRQLRRLRHRVRALRQRRGELHRGELRADLHRGLRRLQRRPRRRLRAQPQRRPHALRPLRQRVPPARQRDDQLRRGRVRLHLRGQLRRLFRPFGLPSFSRTKALRIAGAAGTLLMRCCMHETQIAQERDT